MELVSRSLGLFGLLLFGLQAAEFGMQICRKKKKKNGSGFHSTFTLKETKADSKTSLVPVLPPAGQSIDSASENKGGRMEWKELLQMTSTQNFRFQVVLE